MFYFHTTKQQQQQQQPQVQVIYVRESIYMLPIQYTVYSMYTEIVQFTRAIN